MKAGLVGRQAGKQAALSEPETNQMLEPQQSLRARQSCNQHFLSPQSASVTMGDDGGFQFTVFRGCWAAVGLLLYRLCLLSLLVTITCIRELRYKDCFIQFVHPIVNCPPPPPTMQPITCLSHYVRSVYVYSMLRKVLSDMPVLRYCTAFCNWQCHLFLYFNVSR